MAGLGSGWEEEVEKEEKEEEDEEVEVEEGSGDGRSFWRGVSVAAVGAGSDSVGVAYGLLQLSSVMVYHGRSGYGDSIIVVHFAQLGLNAFLGRRW